MKALTLKTTDFGVTLQPEFIQARDAILAEAATITAVEDELDQHECAEALKALASIASSVEDTRVAVKAPVLDLGRKIDELARGAVAQVAVEKTRLSGLLTRFTVKQREAAEALERARQAEMKRLADEQARRDREEREQAEAAAKAAEAARIAAEAEFLSDPNDEKAKAEALEAQRVADQESAKAEQARIAKATAEASRLQAMVSSKPITSPKIAGISVRDSWNYKVTDLYALYTARPDLCTITDRRAEIVRELKAGATIPGIESWRETVTGVRG